MGGRGHVTGAAFASWAHGCHRFIYARATQPITHPPGTRRQQLYKEVKQASDSMLGMPSQCVVAKKVCLLLWVGGWMGGWVAAVAWDGGCPQTLGSRRCRWVNCRDAMMVV